MKAVLCKAYGMPDTLVVEEVEALHPGKGQVVIAVKACGVNFPDTLIIQGKYQFKPAPPFSPGSEIAGIVKEVGEGVKSLQVGDRVGVGCMVNSCRNCHACKVMKEEQYCEKGMVGTYNGTDV